MKLETSQEGRTGQWYIWWKSQPKPGIFFIWNLSFIVPHKMTAKQDLILGEWDTLPGSLDLHLSLQIADISSEFWNPITLAAPGAIILFLRHHLKCISKALTLQTWGPEFETQNSYGKRRVWWNPLSNPVLGRQRQEDLWCSQNIQARPLGGFQDKDRCCLLTCPLHRPLDDPLDFNLLNITMMMTNMTFKHQGSKINAED